MIGCAVLAEAGLIGFALYCWDRFGNPLEFQASVATFWHSHLTYPLHAFVEDVQFSGLTGGAHPLLTTGHFIYLVDACGAVVAIGALAVGIARCVRDRRWILPVLLLILGAWFSLSTIDPWAGNDARFVSSLVTIYLVAAIVFEYLARRSVLLVAAVLAPAAALGIYIEILFHMVNWII